METATNNFTQEEITSAKAVKQQMLSGSMPNELISIYMAGEICMWDELQREGDREKPYPTDWLLNKFNIPQGATYKEPQVTFRQAAAWIGEYHKLFSSPSLTPTISEAEIEILGDALDLISHKTDADTTGNSQRIYDGLKRLRELLTPKAK